MSTVRPIGIDAAYRADFPPESQCRTCAYLLGECTRVTVTRRSRGSQTLIVACNGYER